MKHRSSFLFNILSLIGLLGNAIPALSQVPTVQDCNGAIPVCQSTYFQANSFSGTGNYPNEINPLLSCLGGEINSVWYTFTVQTAGTLCFSITPNSPTDDYDWALFNLTNANCSDIATNAALQVRCNFDVGGLPPGGVTGATGLAGAGQAPCLNVIPGQTFTLNISNFSASQFGYTLQFTGSAAIFDNIPPTIKPIAAITACGADSLVITFSENVLCSTVSTDDFILTDPNGNNVQFFGITGSVCASGGNQENTYVLRLATALTVQGNYTLSHVGIAGFIFDLCGNGTSPTSLIIPVSFPLVSAGTGTFVERCSTDAPFNLATLLSGVPTAGGTWKDVGTNAVVSSTFTPGVSLPGQYRYVVGTAPCPTDSATVTVQVYDPPQAGTGTTVAICTAEPPFGLFPLLTNADPGGFWTDPSGNPFGGAFTPGTDPAGIYVYNLNGLGPCPNDTAQVQVLVSPKPVFGISLVQASCPPAFLENVTITPTAPGGPYSLEIVGIGANLPLSNSLPAGNYQFIVTAGNGCSDTLPVSFASPQPVDLLIDSLRNPGCSQPNAGLIFTQVSGGSGSFQYFLNGAGPLASGNFTGLSQGPYEVIAQDVNGCRDTVNATLAISTNLAVSVLSFTQPSCNGALDGTLQLAGSGGTAPYSFSLDGFNFFPNNSFTGIPAGMVYLYVVDALGCTAEDSFLLSEPAPLNITLSGTTNPDCFGNANGTVTLAGSGGTLPYQYSLDGVNYQVSNTFSALSTGSYQLSITDTNGCSFSTPYTLTTTTGFYAALSGSLSPTCAGDMDGEIDGQGFGGTAPYSYSLDGINYSPINFFTGLAAGNYTLYVRDAANCLVIIPVSLSQTPGFTLGATGVTQVTCNGAADGSFTLIATGSIGPYQYSIDGGLNFQSSGFFTGLSGGSYPGVAMDGNGCAQQLTVIVNEPNALNLFPLSVLQVACNGSLSGSFGLEAVGGTPPYVFSVNNSPLSSNFQFPGLGAGSYQAVVVDGSGCSDTLNVSITQPAPVTVTAQFTQPFCFGDSNGTVTLRAQGGTQPYYYQDFGGNYLADSVATGLPAGSFTFIAEDDNGCTDTLTINLTQPSRVVGAVDTLIPVSCFKLLDGQIELTASGGAPGYQYAFLGNSPGVDSVFTNLGAGIYSWLITDSRGCIDTLVTNVTEPAAISVFSDSLANPKCAGDLNGLVRLGATGGNTPYQYQQGIGPLIAPGLFQGLASGNYTFFVVDAKGCTDTLSLGLTDPSAVVLTVDSTADIACFGNQTGSIYLSATGGAGNYTFRVDSANVNMTGSFELLGASTYFVSAQDQNGCSAFDTVKLRQAPRLLIFVDSLKPLICAGQSDAYLRVRATGGTGSHQFAINNSGFAFDSVFTPLGAGSYSILVLDSIGCLEDISFTLSEPEILELRDTVKAVSCFGFANGSIRVTANGGKRPYQYSLNQAPSVASGFFTGLDTGWYQVFVTDSLGCTIQTDSLQITQPEPLLIAATGTDVLCAGGNEGFISTQTTGGTPVYHWDWTTGDTTANISNLKVGDYRVIVRDANDCLDTATVTLTEPAPLVLSLISKIDAFCTFPNGSAAVTLEGGTGPVFDVSWNAIPPKNGLAVDSLLPGKYLVLATDSYGCTDTLTVTIGDEPPAQAAFTSTPLGIDPISISDATIQFTNQSTGAVSFLWSFGDGTGVSEFPDPAYTYSEIGEYLVILAAFNRYQDCPTFDTLLISIVPDGKIFIPNAFTPNGDGKNDLFRIVNEGLTSYQLAVFDRWGKSIFLTENSQEGWDGHFPDGQDAPEGVYTFVVKATLTTGETLKRGGTITLIR